MAHVQRVLPTTRHKEHGWLSTITLEAMCPSTPTTHHVEGTLVVILLHKLDCTLVLADMFPEHHILHSAFIVRHVSPPKSVLPLLWGAQ